MVTSVCWEINDIVESNGFEILIGFSENAFKPLTSLLPVKNTFLLKIPFILFLRCFNFFLSTFVTSILLTYHTFSIINYMLMNALI